MIVGFPHRPQEVGGPGSFQIRFESVIEALGHRVVYSDQKVTPDVILVVGGTSRIAWLRDCRERGSKIIHRLDGLNWRHKTVRSFNKYWWMSEIRNRLMSHIRSKLADSVIYQSNFVKEWWIHKHGDVQAPEYVIYNAVDLEVFRPSRYEPLEKPVLISVEGEIQNDDITFGTISLVANNLIRPGVIGAYKIYGKADSNLKNKLSELDGVEYEGQLERQEIPNRLRSAGIFLNLEINPPCPNSVIEALAVGLPVMGYKTGALEELVGDAGVLMDYDADPWKLQRPTSLDFLECALKIINCLPQYSFAARQRAIENFDLDDMVKRYISVMMGQ